MKKNSFRNEKPHDCEKCGAKFGRKVSQSSFFSVQYDCCNSKRFLGFFADLLLFSELKLVCSIISVEAGPVCKSAVV